MGEKASVWRTSKLLLFMLASATIVAVYFSWRDNRIQIANVTAVAADGGIGVYWDSATTNRCQSINWGQLSPGSRKNMVVYLKNEKTEPIFYLLTTENLSPINASNYISLQADYNESQASPGSIRRVSLTLLVSPSTHGVFEFSFNIVVRGSPYLWGDINYDGKVDIRDIAAVAMAFGSYQGSSTWKAEADINGDGKVDIKDIVIVGKNFGKTNP